MLLSAKTGKVRETTPLRRLSHKFEKMKNREVIHRLYSKRLLSFLCITHQNLIDILRDSSSSKYFQGIFIINIPLTEADLNISSVTYL